MLFLPTFCRFYFAFFDGIPGFTRTLDVDSKTTPFKQVMLAATHDGDWVAKPE